MFFFCEKQMQTKWLLAFEIIHKPECVFDENLVTDNVGVIMIQQINDECQRLESKCQLGFFDDFERNWLWSKIVKNLIRKILYDNLLHLTCASEAFYVQNSLHWLINHKKNWILHSSHHSKSINHLLYALWYCKVRCKLIAVISTNSWTKFEFL